MSWHKVCRVDEIPRLGARTIGGAACGVALFRTADDRVFALADKCPHKGGPLSQGVVHGTRVSCPLHDWTVELETGVAVAPDEGGTACYPVRIEGETVLVELP